ncbi:hypothetical protein RRF57_001286 [Xylaria bambusicola]|uniref:Uncharacterized protein n=1 Tax=Xylaria bambusicola TaxID=326684 RepID=A0AAN7U594_9PEZI
MRRKRPQTAEPMPYPEEAVVAACDRGGGGDRWDRRGSGRGLDVNAGSVCGGKAEEGGVEVSDAA